MSTTKNATLGIKKFSNILFTFTIFFTSCCFIDHTKLYFFFTKFEYRGIKFLLAVILPVIITAVHYMINKDLLFIADRTASIMGLYTFLYALDSLTLKLMWFVEKSISLYHLAYGLETFFSVLAVMTLIAAIQQKNGIFNNHYAEATKSFFVGSIPVFIIGFVMSFIVIRIYGGEYNAPNLIPFNGEMSAFIKQGEPQLLIRDAGNVFFFTALTVMLFELTKRHKKLWAIGFPVILSISMEFYQYFFKCGDPDIDDVILNTAGTVLGCILYKLIIEKIKEKELCWESLEQWMWK